MPRNSFQDCCCQCSHLHGRQLPTHTSTGNPPTLAGRSGSACFGVTISFPWILMHTRFCLCPPRVESLFPYSCVSPTGPTGVWRLILWGFPVPLLDPQAGKSDMRLRTFTTVGELLWYYCSPDCILPTQQIWYLILSCLHPSYHLFAASSLTLDMVILFWWVPASSCQWLFNS